MHLDALGTNPLMWSKYSWLDIYTTFQEPGHPNSHIVTVTGSNLGTIKIKKEL